jgi:hypothetical protein
MIWKDINELESAKYKAGHSGSTATGTEEDLGGLKDDEKGRLAPHDAAILLKCLYGASMVRFDILRAITRLPCRLTRWTSECDRRLHRLMCYINSTKHLRMIGWVGDDAAPLQPNLFADAVFCGLRCYAALHLWFAFVDTWPEHLLSLL